MVVLSENEILSSVINNIFPKLQISEKQLLTKYLLNIIDAIHTKLLIDIDNYKAQLRQNNYRDIQGLLLILLPFINEKVSTQDVTSLNDIYTVKTTNIDISKESPQYKYSNIQYGRCNRNPIEEIQYNKTHLEHNYRLLLNTINRVTNKLYVNWINIVPISDSSLSNSTYYQTTLNNFLKKQVPNVNVFKTDKLESGMDCHDAYNIMRNLLFENIKNIKWTLYDVYVNGSPNKYLHELHYRIDLTNIYNGIEWKLLSKDNQDTFSYNMYNQLSNFVTQNNYVIKVLMFYFNKYYDQVDKLNNYKRVNIDEEDNEDIEDDDNKADLIKYREAAQSLTINDMSHLYTFIYKSISKLKTTYYWKYLQDLTDNSSYIDGLSNITLKNIYNFSKSFVSISTNKLYFQLPKFFDSLDNNNRNIISDRLNQKDTNWFTITGYLTKIAQLSKQDAITENTRIYSTITYFLPTILCDILVYNGLLSEFVYSPNMTNYINLPKNTSERNNKILQILSTIDKSQYDDAYYYLNNTQFGNIYYDDKQRYIDMLGTNKSMSNWVFTYAMDWISQIAFFHKYINNRVIYVTGGTGVGKSTQVPKLLLYGLKMIDYKPEGRIACTQPRVPPTVKNSEIISSQLGVPIKINKENTTNPTIQYRTQEKSYTQPQEGLIMTIMTDGTLEAQLSNPILKTFGSTSYTSRNQYDIVIVDEAHEHNVNMDIILTKMNECCYYNNDLKLVIISATMDDDEPIYRRYYRNINDNKKYPLSVDIKENNIDRINIDRRIHISPPGQVTQYKIEDIYKPEYNSNEGILSIISSIINQEGDVLIFQPGEYDIKVLVDMINQTTPSNVIAIPYFSKMTDDQKDFVGDISFKKYELDIPKSKRFDIEEPYSPVPKGTYNKVIIVATNIAEASITIDSLRFVIDTGTQKRMIYDYKTNSEILVTNGISESSRLQRKGRVGRVAPGTVYYLYKEDEMKKNKQYPAITISNFAPKLLQLLASTNSQEYFPNDSTLSGVSSINLGLDKFIKSQYYIGQLFYTYIGDSSHYDYKNNKVPNKMLYKIIDNKKSKQIISGYSANTLNDTTGTFYIVHPEETEFVRNIIGEITNSPSFDKMKGFWNYLNNNKFVVDGEKTDYGSLIESVSKQILGLTFNQIISYLYSLVYKVDKDMIKYLAFIRSLKSCKDICLIDEKYRNNLPQIKSAYGSNIGDSETIIRLMNMILLNTNQPNLNQTNVNSVVKSYNNLVEQINSIKLLKDGKLIINKKDELDEKNKELGDITAIKNNALNININKIQLSLLYGYSNNIAQQLTVLNDHYFYFDLFNPSITNIYKIPKLFESNRVKKIQDNTFINNISSTLLFVKNEEDIESGDNSIYYIENIEPKVIKIVLKSMFPLEYNINQQKQDVMKYIDKLKEEYKGTSVTHTIISKYIDQIKTIDYFF